MLTFNRKEIDILNNIACEAGRIIMSYYHESDIQYELKKDQSEVTKADLAANDYIIESLQEFFPNFQVISEEKSKEANLKAAESSEYFIIDPLDGTKGFINKNDEFTVNIAFVKEGKLEYGSIYLPVQDVLYFTDADYKAFKREEGTLKQIEVQQKVTDSMKIICTHREPEKSHIISYLKKKNIKTNNIISIGSSYKFCLIAEGVAGLYPRQAQIMAWDVAAGNALVEAAGGKMLDYSGQRINYQFSCNSNFNITEFIVSGNFPF